MRRHQFLRRLAAVACAVALLHALPASAQNWPTRPIRIVVPFATGGSADVYARFLAQRLPELLGQPVVVENRPGAGAVIGTDLVAKAPPDGYTLLLMSNTHTVNETLVANKPYNLTRDFVAVAPVNYADLLFVAHPSVPANNVREVLQLARERPGKLNYASSGTGTPYHMAGELFKSMSGTYLVHIPYKGSSGARTDLLGGQVDLMFDAVTTMVEQVKSGKVKAIATTGKQRSAVLPDVPTVHESGLPNYEATIWLGLLAPRGTPPEVVTRLNAAVSRITSQPDVQQGWTRQGATAMVMSAPAFDKYLQDDIQKWARLIRAANIKAD
jgi:tripartite-type tricarboxylate transporter receptor subunit TctC